MFVRIVRAAAVGGALLLAAFVLGPAAPAEGTVDVPRMASLVLKGERGGDAAGASVARVGDVNGDGRSDVVVGAPLADPLGRQDAGAAYVVFGGGARGHLRLGSLGARGFRIAGAVAAPPGTYHPGERHGAGAVVAGAGDVNGDGLADVLVSGSGAVNVVFGKRDAAPVDLAALGAGGYAILSDGDFGLVVAGRPAGDVNGDGLADVAVTVDVDGDEDAGSLYVAFGKADAAPLQVSVFQPPSWALRVGGGLGGMFLGSGAAPAGDLNRDGLGDLLIGAPGTPGPGGRSGRGAVFVVYGTRDPGSIRVRPPEPFGGLPPEPFSGYLVRGPRGSGGFGSAVARLGRGFVAGAPGSTLDFPLRGRGSAWIVRSRRARPIRLAGPHAGGPAGVAVDAPGDVGGGSGRDVLVMTRGRRRGAAGALLFSIRGRRVVTYRGLRNGQWTRASAAGAGDVGGSRRNDLVFGSPGANAAYVVTSAVAGKVDHSWHRGRP